MKKPLLTLGRVVLTLLVVTFAAVLVWQMVVLSLIHISEPTRPAA